MKESYSKKDFINGQVILINKPYKWTSFDVVKKIRYLLKNNFELKKIKVGHAGTLDPLATGLIIICTGKFTKQISTLINADKKYEAEIRLGATTPSFDLETKIDNEFEVEHITAEKVKKILKEEFNGIISQIPPLYSAKHINGVRAYKLARKGEKIELEPIKIEILNIELQEFKLPLITLQVHCSKGTYIRSLARDIGIKLNSGAYLQNLKRVAIGDYYITNAILLEEFEKRLKI